MITDECELDFVEENGRSNKSVHLRFCVGLSSFSWFCITSIFCPDNGGTIVDTPDISTEMEPIEITDLQYEKIEYENVFYFQRDLVGLSIENIARELTAAVQTNGITKINCARVLYNYEDDRKENNVPLSD